MDNDSGIRGYYGRPVVKPAPFDKRVAGYTFLGGLAGTAQVIAAVSSTFGGERTKGLARQARYLAVAGVATGPWLLISHLKTPQRWYNMLRIFRPTSPMSVGSWILTGFGLTTALTAVGQFARDRGRRGRLVRLSEAMQWPAALLGASMASYTAALLSSTSTPRWAAAPRALGVQFGSSAMAGAAALLSLGQRVAGRRETSRRLDTVAMLATGVELAATCAAGQRYREAVRPSGNEGSAAADGDDSVAPALALALPLSCYAVNAMRRKPSTALSVVAAVSVLAGGAVMRDREIRKGRRSASEPDDYLNFTRAASRSEASGFAEASEE